MRTIISSGAFFLGLALAATTYADAPKIKVCVSDERGMVAFKDGIHADAGFATGSLKPGNYVVEFKSSRGLPNDDQYLVVVSAGPKKVVADSVSGENISGGGIAMRIQVGSGLQITGQIARERGTASTGHFPVRVIEKERMRQFQDHAGESSLLNHFAGRPYLMTGQTGRGY
jgi:hypothetical protein